MEEAILWCESHRALVEREAEEERRRLAPPESSLEIDRDGRVAAFLSEADDRERLLSDPERGVVHRHVRLGARQAGVYFLLSATGSPHGRTFGSVILFFVLPLTVVTSGIVVYRGIRIRRGNL